MIGRFALATLPVALTLGQAHAAGITVQDAWARATAPHARSAAVYLSIKNTGDADTLTAVKTPVAGDASVHQTVKTGDVVGMRRVEGGLAVSASGPTVLAPGGYHIMLMQLQKQLVDGTEFPLTLTFAKAGKVDASVHVEAAGANGPMQDMGAGHDLDATPAKTR